MNSKVVDQLCQNCKSDFEITSDDFSFYKKINVPPPTFCSECRLIRRLSWRNERTLHKRNCDLCNKSMLSIYNKKSPYKVYCRDCWWSDSWNPEHFSQDYDFSRLFFEQYNDFLLRVPRVALTGSNNVNSDYCNYSLSNKNSYLCFASHYNEDSGYLDYSNKCIACFDCLHVGNSEYSLGSNYCDKLFQCAYMQYSFDCVNCYLGYDLRNCSNCFGCVGLRNKTYNIFNVQYTKEEYLEKLKSYLKDTASLEIANDEFESLNARTPKLFSYQKKNDNCTGNDIEDSRNLKNAFSVKFSEDSKNLFINCIRVKSSMDVNNVAQDPSELLYESQGITNSSNVLFCDASWGNTFVTYCNSCFSSNNLFACIGINKGEYMIFNKKYSKEEYFELKERIIEHMKAAGEYGEFFPIGSSPFGYNESIAEEYFPLTKEEVLGRGYKWIDKDITDYKPTVFAESFDRSISSNEESILKEVIECAHKGSCNHQCTKAFRVIENELNIYKKLNISLPALCPNCRHCERLNKRNPIRLWHRQCMCDKKHPNHNDKCQVEFETSYDPDRSEIVYCEKCYQQEMY